MGTVSYHQLLETSVVQYGYFIYGLDRDSEFRRRSREDINGADIADTMSFFSLNNRRLALLAFIDLVRCFNELGYGLSDSDIHSYECTAFAMMMSVLVGSDVQMAQWRDVNVRIAATPRFCEMAVQLSAQASTNSFKGNLLLAHVLREFGRLEDARTYAVLLYRWASILVKADGRVTAVETRGLKRIMKFAEADKKKRTSGSGASVPAEGQDDSALAKLDRLVGLATVKGEVRSLANFLNVQKMRQEQGLPGVPLSRHLVFAGNPGSGKTTVARIIADVYRELGLLERGHLVETDRSGLVAGYVGQTAEKTSRIIDSALGGVLFIDEAYTLAEGGPSDYGQEALATLIKRMEDDRERLVVIVAGYPERMERFLAANPGLRSRFGKVVQFEDYTADEMLEIFCGMIERNRYFLAPDALEAARRLFADAVQRSEGDSLGNGRFVRNVFEAVLEWQASRLAGVAPITPEMLAEITAADITPVI